MAQLGRSARLAPGTRRAVAGRHMKTLLLGLGTVLSTFLIGCAGSDPVEDAENDEFLTPDAKADAFGVEDWSPDGAAVLKLVSSASASKLEDDVGLSARAAKAIVAQRTTLTDKKYTDLAQLDAAKYVGTTVFNRLLKYAADHHLFKTALRIPLLVENQDDETKSLLASFNDKAHTAGVSGFARYTFVDTDSKYSEKMDAYDARLQAIATKLHITIPGEMMRFGSGLSDYNVGSSKVCYVGDPNQVADVAGSQADSVVGDMYIVWAWRAGTKKFVDDNVEDPAESFGDDWTKYKTSSDFVRLIFSDDDEGTNTASDDIPPCR